MKYYFKIILLFFFCEINVIFLQAQENNVQVISMQKAVETAINNNPLIEITSLEIEIQTLQNSETIILAPRKFNFTPNNLIESQINNNYEIVINFDSKLFFSKNSEYSSLLSSLKTQEAKLFKKEITKEVKTIFNNWIFLINKARIINQQIQNTYELKSIIDNKYKLGDIDFSKKIETDAKLAQVSSKFQILKDELLKTENKLSQIINTEGNFVPENDSLKIYKITFASNLSDKFSFTNMLDYYQTFCKIAETNFKLKNSKLFPNKQKIKKALLTKQIALNNYNYQKFYISKTINNLIINLNQYQNQLAYYHEIGLENTILLQDISALKLKKEEIDYLEYLESINNTLNIKLQYLTVLKNYNNTAILLESYLN